MNPVDVLPVLVFAFFTFVLVMFVRSLIKFLTTRGKEEKELVEAAIDRAIERKDFRRAKALSQQSGNKVLIAGVRAEIEKEKEAVIREIYYERWKSDREYEQLVRMAVHYLKLAGSSVMEWQVLVTTAINTNNRRVRKFLAKHIPSPAWRRQLVPPRRRWWKRH